MMTADQCRWQAADMAALAERAFSAEDARRLDEMAQLWRNLAVLADVQEAFAAIIDCIDVAA